MFVNFYSVTTDDAKVRLNKKNKNELVQEIRLN